MGIVFRRVLACLLMLAIPLQGFAAVAMLHCAPAHHGATNAPAHVHASTRTTEFPAGHANGLHDHATHAHAGHDHAVAADADARVDVVPPPGLSAGDQVANAKCSACASCCSSAFIVSSLAVPVAFATTAAPLLAALGLAVSFITDGPSRPPRIRLA